MSTKENILVTTDGRKKIKIPVKEIVKRLEEEKIPVLEFGDEKRVLEGQAGGGVKVLPCPPCE